MEPNFFDDYKNLINSINNMTKAKEGYGYRYVELTPLLEEVMPKIHEHNFILTQTVKQSSSEFVRETTHKDQFTKITTPAFVLHSELEHVTGKKLECDMPLYVDDIDPQALGSAETYMRRYSIYALLHIKTEDDDGVAGSAKGKRNAPKLETFADFVKAIYSADNEKRISALWYQWKEKFTQDSEEYKNLSKFSGNCKLKVQNPEMTVDIFDKCSEIVKTIVGVN